MATFTITTQQNITALTGKGGGDTYNVNGGTLVIDSDTRYGLNQSLANGPLGNINLSPTLGGSVVIDGTNVRLIPFTGGAGVVPAAGTIVGQGAVSAELLCVMATRVGGAVSVAGSTMPATGYLKVRNRTGGNFAPGLFTQGLVGNATAVDETGWFELVGQESLTLTVCRLNSLTINGAWFYLGTTTGTRGQQIQLPAFDPITEYPGVEIETFPGSGVYVFYANAAGKFQNGILGTDSRSRYVGISQSGMLIIGQSFSNGAAVGQLPVAGCNIRIPNIICSSCASTQRQNNVVPNSIMGTRYELATNASGVVSITRVTGSWYWNIQQPYSVYIKDLHTCEQFILAETSLPPTIDGLHVGLSNQATPFASNAIVFQQCLNGGTANNVSGLRAEQISTSGYAIYFVNLYNGWTLSNVRGQYASDATAVAGAIFFNTCDTFSLTSAEVIGKRMLLSACSNFSINGVYYAASPKANTVAAQSCQAVEVMGNSKTGFIDGIYNWPNVNNVHPYAGAVYANTTTDVTVRNVGSIAEPFNSGGNAATSMGYLFSDGGLNTNIRFQKCWLTNLRLGLASSTNTTNKTQMQNCYNTDATLTQGPNWYNATVRGNRQNAGVVPVSYTHVDGTHFYDAFTGDTTARAFLVFTEMSNLSQGAYVINSGNPRFTSQGSIVLKNVGDQITWTWNYFVLGWSALTSFAVTGTNFASNHLAEYDIDKGSGFSGTFKTLSAANLAAETAISPTLGFKLKLRITCTTSATTNVLTSLVINGTTTLAQQNAALYPIDSTGLTLSGIIPGSDVVVTQAGTSNLLSLGDSIAGSAYTYSYGITQSVDIAILCSGYVPYYIRNYPLSVVPVTIPVTQQFNRNYQ